jgi:hypothetical protein
LNREEEEEKKNKGNNKFYLVNEVKNIVWADQKKTLVFHMIKSLWNEKLCSGLGILPNNSFLQMVIYNLDAKA